MSGYNAEHGIPAGDRDNAEETPVVPETVRAWAPWEVPSELALYGSNFESMTKETADKLIAEGNVDVASLMATMRQLLWASRQEIQADDHRIAHIWEQAGEIADQKGYCDVFETFMEELGTGYAREIDVVAYVDVKVTVPVYLTVSKNADVSDYLETSLVQEAFNNCDVDLSSSDWEFDYSELAD